MSRKPFIHISTFYKFFAIPADKVEATKKTILDYGSQLGIRGLFIIGTEGVNATFCGPTTAVTQFKNDFPHLVGSGEILFKDSFAEKYAFHNLKVKVREEIVTLSRPDLVPKEKTHRHLSPAEWHKALQEEGVKIIDTRNSFEYDVGHFKGAVDPKTEEFSEFPNYLREAEAKGEIKKDQKVLIYCTGGIRCEKAILEMEEQGYKNVYQLDGGILNYLKEFPEQGFEGECFVFDYRVAVDQHLKPTEKFRLCPHCGQPGTVPTDCIQCGVNEIVCQPCLDKEDQFKTCSKNCAHHFRMGHKTTRIHKDAFRRRMALDTPAQHQPQKI
ncbi:MAG: rhodanese-like domain-containing protein [Bdellovibrionota bacterium]